MSGVSVLFKGFPALLLILFFCIPVRLLPELHNQRIRYRPDLTCLRNRSQLLHAPERIKN